MIDRVLVLSQRASSVWKHMSADIAHGFRKLGLDVQFVEELHTGPLVLDDKDIPLYWKDIVQCQLEFKPQLIFQMGHLRFAYPHGMWSGDAVHVTWVQDWHHWILGVEAHGSIPNAEQVKRFNASKDLIFYSFPALGEAILMQGYAPKRVLFLPPGVNADRFYPAPMPEGEFTVGFPCNIGAPMTANDPTRLARRLDPVKWLTEAGVRIRLWGQGWENYGFKSEGSVTNGAPLRRAYQSCHAVLQSNSDTCYHQRAYEALGCGRPVLRYLNNDTAPFPNTYDFDSRESFVQAVLDLKVALPSGEQSLLMSSFHDYTNRCRTILNALP